VTSSCASAKEAAATYLEPTAGLTNDNPTLATLNGVCASTASSLATGYASYPSALCCPSLADGPLAALGSATTCQTYSDAVGEFCDIVNACNNAQPGRRLSESSATLVTLILLTQGVSSSEVSGLQSNLGALLANPVAFQATAGYPLASVQQMPTIETVSAPACSQCPPPLGLSTPGGDDNGWMGPAFGGLGGLFGLLGLWVWCRQRKSRADMNKLLEPTGRSGAAKTGPVLAKHSVKGGHAAGSEMIGYDGGSQLSSAI